MFHVTSQDVLSREDVPLAGVMVNWKKQCDGGGGLKGGGGDAAG